MTADPVRHIDEDGSIYAAEIVPPDTDTYGAKYHVDLVRASVDSYGLEHEQRLTVAEYRSWGEAEEHLTEVEQGLSEQGLAALGEDVQRLRDVPYTDDPVYLTAIYPPDAAEGQHHLSAQLLAVSADGIASATLAVGDHASTEAVIEPIDRALATEGIDAALMIAQQTVELHGGESSPLFEQDDTAVRHLDGGGTAHWFAITPITDPETDPYELRYFRVLDKGVGATHRDSYPVMPLPDDDPASAWALPGLEMYLQKGDVYMAQQFAHDVAQVYDQSFPAPMDLPAFDPKPEYYFGYGVSEANNPALEGVKTWMHGGERRFDTFTIAEYGAWEEAQSDEQQLETTLKTKGLEAAMNLAESMAEAGGYLDPHRTDGRVFFEDDAPADPFTTNRERALAAPDYSVGAVSTNGESFLDVLKTWGDDQHERLVIPQPDWELAQQSAALTTDLIEKGQIQQAMRLVEDQGVAAGVIDPEREDPRLFTHGPLDPFMTTREEQLDEELARYGVTWRQTHEWAQTVQPDITTSSEEMNPHWRLETLPVNNPDGEPLGQALHMLMYPHVEHNPDQPTEISPDEPFRMLEMAHFETTEAADKFSKEFNGYLMPGLLDGPELAVEVARLEGLPTEWKTLEGDDLKAFQNAELTLTRDVSDWHPYNPHAERDTRIAA